MPFHLHSPRNSCPLSLVMTHTRRHTQRYRHVGIRIKSYNNFTSRESRQTSGLSEVSKHCLIHYNLISSRMPFELSWMVLFALLEGTLALSCSGTKKISDALWCGRPEPSLGEVAEIKCFLSVRIWTGETWGYAHSCFPSRSVHEPRAQICFGKCCSWAVRVYTIGSEIFGLIHTALISPSDFPPRYIFHMNMSIYLLHRPRTPKGTHSH